MARLETDCLHCGQPLGEPDRWLVQMDGQDHGTCCAGCQAVASSIISAGLAHYYHRRPLETLNAATPMTSLQAQLDRLAVYDNAQTQSRYTGRDSEGVATVDLAVHGMHCGACVWLLERTLRRQPGVIDAAVSFATERARVRFDPALMSVASLLRSITSIGLQPVPLDGSRQSADSSAAARQMLQRLFVAGLAMVQVMMYALPAYVSAPGDIELSYEQLFRWSSLLLTTPVVVYSAWPFFVGAWRDLRNAAPGMDVPVALGVAVAYGYSVSATLTGNGAVYFDSITMFVFLLLLARYVEWRIRRRAAVALDAMAASTPDTATRVLSELGANNLQMETVPVSALVPDDIIQMSSGQSVPVDASLQGGATSIDESVLTGESVPRRIDDGESIAAGAIICGPGALLRVVRAATDSTLATIEQLIARGLADKPQTLILADQVARYFVVVILALTALAAAVWSFIEPSRAGTVAITVLIISCPCALSLATPAALAAAMGSLVKSGALITRGHALSTLAQVTDVVFDKTGTLTQGKPSLAQVHLAEGVTRDQALALAAAVEVGSSHPFASAIREAARQAAAQQGCQFEQQLRDRHDEPGGGVAAVMQAEDGSAQYVRVGSAHWCGLTSSQANLLRMPGAHSEVFLAVSDPSSVNQPRRGDDNSTASMRALACFALVDRLQDGAQRLVEQLQHQGYQLHLLSGDREVVVNEIANRLAISRRQSQASPAKKRDYVQDLQDQGRIVLMVGDGINDAPVLAQANVSVALGGASDLALRAADAVILSPQVARLAQLLDKARRTRQLIRQNITWALTYNALALPLAFAGEVPAWGAALGMAGSSLLVTANSARLWRTSPLRAATRFSAENKLRSEAVVPCKRFSS